MTKFIRKEGFLAPILIYMEESAIHFTHYVESYNMVGSSVHSKEFKQYVDALGNCQRDDIQWINYGGS